MDSTIQNKQKTIIIIGAGMSGLSCAYHLVSKLLYQNIQLIIIEARERIGGRINTLNKIIFHQNITIDLGASWIHDSKDNPLIELAKKFNMQLSEEENYDDGIETNFTFDNNGKLIPIELANKLHKKLNKLLLEICETKIKENQPDISLREALNQSEEFQKLKKEIKENYKFFFESHPDPDLLDKMIELKFVACEGFNAATMEEMSVIHSMEQSLLPGSSDQFVINGYFQMLKGMLETISKLNTKILLQHEVQKIHYNFEEKKVHIYGENKKNNSNFDITGDCVLITLPLGVLKKNFVKFDPPLPSFKVNSIKKMGFGLLNKIILIFDKQICKSETFWINYLGNERGEFPSFLNLNHYFNSTDDSLGIIVGFVNCNFAKQIEDLSDKEIIEKVLTILEKIYGNVVHNHFVDGIITRWNKDPYSCGSYSFCALGGEGAKDFENLEEPILEYKMFFAGEATEPKRYGTVLGAFLSGKKAAEKISLLFQ